MATFRTGRVYELTDKTGCTTWHLSAENGMSEWKFSSPIVNCTIDDDKGRNSSITFKTESGSYHTIWEYSVAERYSTYKQYMNANNMIASRILSFEDFKKVWFPT